MAFKHMDLMGSRPSLYINQSQRHKTNLGTCFTILISFFTILVFCGFGMDMLGRKNPSLYESKLFNLSNELNFKEIPFMLGLMMVGGFSIPDLKRHLNVKLQLAKTNSSNVEVPTLFIETDLVPCKEIFFYKENFLGIQSKAIGDPNNFFCLPENYDEKLLGQFGNPIFNRGSIFVEYCKNSTANNNSCLPLNIIKKNLQYNIYSQFITLNHYTDLTDYELPMKPLWSSSLSQLSSTGYRSDEYTYTVVEMQSDEGWILEDKRVQSSFLLGPRSSIIFNPNDSDILMIQLDISNLNLITGRKYITLQTIIANTGGFIKGLTMLFCFILEYFTNFYYIEEIYLKAFTSYENFANKKENIEQGNTSEIKNLKTNNFIRSNYNNTIQLRNKNRFATKKELKTKNSEKNMTKIKKFYYKNLSPFFCLCKDRSFKLVNKLNKVFREDMDMSSIFFMTQKFKLTEALLFNSNILKIKELINNYEILNKLEINQHMDMDDDTNILEVPLFHRELKNLKKKKNIIDVNDIIYEKLKQLDMV